MIDHSDPVANEWDELVRREEELKNRIDRESPTVYEQKKEEHEALDFVLQKERQELEWVKDAIVQTSNEKKKVYALERCKYFLELMKLGRGKPGRHPKPFNVLVYHLVSKVTTWKFDWKVPVPAGGHPPYMFRKDGQHRFVTGWRLICYLILKIHIRIVPIPEVERFIFKNKKKPAAVGLRDLKNDLLSRYKNFPSIPGWPFPRAPVDKIKKPDPETSEKKYFSKDKTGFTKIVVTDDGGLEVVVL